MNPVIGYADNNFQGIIVEFCTNYSLVGQYLIVTKNCNGGNIQIAEIQITVF